MAGGCTFFKERVPPPPCPPVFVLKDASSLTRFKAGAGRDITDVIFEARIVDFRGFCEYNDKRTKVEIKLSLAFNISRGPANRDRKASFDYFIAIPKFHPAPQGKNSFDLKVEFARNIGRVQKLDEVNMEIPLAPKIPFEEYAIYIGFQMTRQELQENRRRFRP